MNGLIDTVDGKPVHDFLIDVAGSCNLRCASCPVGHMKSEEFDVAPRSKGFMDVDSFQKIVQKIKNEATIFNHHPNIHFYNWGEPLIHPKIVEFIKIAKTNGISANVSSNFNVDIDLEEFVKAEPDWIRVSVSGWNNETYQKTHRRGDINLVKSNLYRLKHFLSKHKITSKVEVSYHCYKDNLEAEITTAAKEVEALGFTFRAVYAYFMSIEKLLNADIGKELSAEDKVIESRLLVPLNKSLEISKQAASNTCNSMDHLTVINWDNSVPICCGTYDPKYTMVNNYLEHTFAEVQKSRMKNNVCGRCMKAGIHDYGNWQPRQLWNAEVKNTLMDISATILVQMP